MQEVQVLDKTFVESISEVEIKTRIAELGKHLNETYKGKNPLIVSVLNGAFLFTADLVRHLDWDPEIQFMRVSSYEGGTSSLGRIRILHDLECSVAGRDVLFVEDIVDTGTTLEWLRKYLMSKDANSVELVTLLFKKDAFKAATPPEYIGFSIPNLFVVGYGMDYGERGRALPSIYVLKG